MSYYVTHRLLNCVFQIRASSPTVLEGLRFLLLDATQNLPITRRVEIAVTESAGGWMLAVDGQSVATDLTADEIMVLLFRQFIRTAYETADSPTRLHAACGLSPGGRRFLITGVSGAGKTSLVTRLLLDGIAMQSDDICHMDGSRVVPFPRLFHLKERGLGLFPEIAPRIAAWPVAEAEPGQRVYAYSPTEFGVPWVIESRPVDAIFALSPNHGGATDIRRTTKIDMAQRMVGEARPGDTRGRWLADVCRMLDSAECFVLTNGDLGTAARAVLDAVS